MAKLVDLEWKFGGIASHASHLYAANFPYRLQQEAERNLLLTFRFQLLRVYPSDLFDDEWLPTLHPTTGNLFKHF